MTLLQSRPRQTKKPRRKKTNILFFVLIALSILILLADITFQVKTIRHFVGYIIFPSQKYFSEFFNYSENVSKNIKGFVALFERNQKLEAENNELKSIRENYDLIISENERLRQMLAFQKTSDRSLMPARIVGRSTSDWYRVVIINKGEEYNIEKGDVVIVGEDPLPKLVGQIVEVMPKFSKVLLITDSNSSVAGYLTNANLDGIVEGKNDGTLVMKFVNSNAVVDKGEIVISSGLGGIFPFGLYIGNIQSVINNPEEEFQNIVIKVAVDLNRLREVFIIKAESKK
ncbi:MAG: rod shape-determining protein MreC [Elusimicrobiota bacterium]